MISRDFGGSFHFMFGILPWHQTWKAPDLSQVEACNFHLSTHKLTNCFLRNDGLVENVTKAKDSISRIAQYVRPWLKKLRPTSELCQ